MKSPAVARAILIMAGISIPLHATRPASVRILDRDYLLVHFKDGEVFTRDDGIGPAAFETHHEDDQDTVKTYGSPLNTSTAVTAAGWVITSTDDPAYGADGRSPTACHRKSKLNGMAEKAWAGSDYQYQHTLEHFIYLKLPSSLVQGRNYTLRIAAGTNSDVATASVTFDVFSGRSEALHVNLVGYLPDPAYKAADLYHWMGDGGARDYSGFVGNTVYLYNVGTQRKTAVGKVAFWKAGGAEAQWYNLTGSSVWSADFPGFAGQGTFRLVVDGVGCSQDFRISSDVYSEPFQVSVKGFFYMRIGQDSTGGIRPVPRRPLYIPGKSPSNTTVYITTMHPFHSGWTAFAGGSDAWDKKDEWAAYKKPGDPTNPNAWGGHSDALDWDRHLGHVSIIYDMLLPFILTGGAIDNDDLGIAESGNDIPDILDEARNEVDFWLRLRDGQGYGHGLNNPNGSNVFYQAGATAIAAWANAANAAMLAECFRIAGKTALMAQYRDSAIAAYSYASGLADQMLDKVQNVGEAALRGRDFKMTAAAFLYNVTGETAYESVINGESVCTGPTAVLDDNSSKDQIWATTGYLFTNRTVNHRTLHDNMKASIIHQAKEKNANYIETRPSRRSTDNNTGYFQTIQNVHRVLIAHAITGNQSEKDLFLKALILEADYGLGRNPLNLIQMTTASTGLSSMRSVENIYTSGRDDGTPGLHPGHTPYLNTDDWYCGMIMGCPSWMANKGYPALDSWPKAECYYNSRYVWAHSEFTPQQTMRGKMALYGYLHGLGLKWGGASTGRNASRQPRDAAAMTRQGRSPGDIRIFDLTGRTIWAGRTPVRGPAWAGPRNSVCLVVDGKGQRSRLVGVGSGAFHNDSGAAALRSP